MIDLKELRENPAKFIEGAKRKGFSVNIEEALEVDERARSLRVQAESLRAEQNRFNKELPKLAAESRQDKLASMKELANQQKELLTQVKELEASRDQILLRVPNPPLAEVPDGKDDSENRQVRTWGEVPTQPAFFSDHVKLGLKLGLFDFERGVKVAGARSYFLKGNGVRLQHAVLALAMNHLVERGYTMFDPPLLVNYASMLGTGYFPGGEEQAYRLDDRDPESYLIGTSEVSVCSYHMNEILKNEELPKRYAGLSSCFRREAGAAGKDTHGLYRVHQFQKVEQVIIARADKEESDRLHLELLKNAEDLMHILEIPYRVVDVCTGDLGLGQVKKHDIEAWMPSRKAYSETHSCSSFYDFQARRLDLRYKDSDGTNRVCYTLNNTAIAAPRILIPLLELNQQEDGSIKIPTALQPYMQGQKVIGSST